MGFRNCADVGSQLWVLVFAPLTASRREVLQAAHPLLRLVQSLLDSVASPAEAPFGQSSTATAQFRCHLGLEQAAFVAGESSRPRTEQRVVLVCGAFHGE